MIRIRAKIKVRYAILLCLASVIGVYSIIKITVCCEDLLRQSAPKLSRGLPNQNILLRSFTAKGHDTRELLSDISETQKRAEVRAKFLGHLEQSNLGEQFDKPQMDEENPNEVKMEIKQEEILQNGDFENPDEVVDDQAEEAKEKKEEQIINNDDIENPDELEEDQAEEEDEEEQMISNEGIENPDELEDDQAEEVEKEEQKINNDGIENPDELDNDQVEEEDEEGEEETTNAVYTTAAIEIFENNNKKNNPENIRDERNFELDGEAHRQVAGLKRKITQDNVQKDSLMDLNRDDKGVKNERGYNLVEPPADAEEKLVKTSNHKADEEIHENPRIPAQIELDNGIASNDKNENDAPVPDEQNFEEYDPQNLENRPNENSNNAATKQHENKNDPDDAGAEENAQPYYANDEEHLEQKGEEIQQNDAVQEDGDDEDDEDEEENEKKSNKTIFDPRDSVITYHALHDENFLIGSQINESRGADLKRASEFPMTPEEALRRYGDQLPPWEQYEILHYPKIYYLGLHANKTQIQSNTSNNFGFDYDSGTDDEGHYKIVVGDHIGYRYEILKYLGSGTFGAVILARDWSNPTASDVALKIMHYDENLKYILREINMMKFIEANASNHNYFSRMIATFKFRNHHCLVLELLGKSVHRHNIDPVHDVTLFRRFATDILKGMNYLAELNIVHGDLKPDNIMFIYGKNNQSAGQLLKVADFGIGCIPGSKEFKCPAYYMQTRYYRAPEVILSLEITPQADMFSVGVIFAEFFIGLPPFFGETEPDQLAAMMEVLGLPPTWMIAKSPRKKIYAKAICYETENGFHRKPYRKPLPKILKGMDPSLYDLIARCLEYDPKLRITPQQALRHPFITGAVPAIGLPPPVALQRLMGDI